MNGKTGWWVAGILAAAMVASFVPSIAWFASSLRTPSKVQVDRIEERQQIVLQRLATVDARLVNADMQVEELQQQLTALQDELRQHENSSR